MVAKNLQVGLFLLHIAAMPGSLTHSSIINGLDIFERGDSYLEMDETSLQKSDWEQFHSGLKVLAALRSCPKQPWQWYIGPRDRVMVFTERGELTLWYLHGTLTTLELTIPFSANHLLDIVMWCVSRGWSWTWHLTPREKSWISAPWTTFPFPSLRDCWWYLSAIMGDFSIQVSSQLSG